MLRTSESRVLHRLASPGCSGNGFHVCFSIPNLVHSQVHSQITWQSLFGWQEDQGSSSKVPQLCAVFTCPCGADVASLGFYFGLHSDAHGGAGLTHRLTMCPPLLSPSARPPSWLLMLIELGIVPSAANYLLIFQHDTLVSLGFCLFFFSALALYYPHIFN